MNHQYPHYPGHHPQQGPDPSPTPSQNHAGIGTRTFYSPQLALGSYLRQDHLGYRDPVFDHQAGTIRGAGQAPDRRWNWEYDDQGRLITHQQPDEEGIGGKRYEDIPASTKGGRPGGPRARRETSEATDLLRAALGGVRQDQGDGANVRQPQQQVASPSSLSSSSTILHLAQAGVGTLRSIVEDPMVVYRGGIGLLGSGWMGSIGGTGAANTIKPGEDKRLPGVPVSPPRGQGAKMEGIPAVQQIKRKPLPPPSSVLIDSSSRVPQAGRQTVRINLPPPTNLLTNGPYTTGTGVHPDTGTKSAWKPRGQIGSILMNTTRGRGGAGGLGGGKGTVGFGRGGGGTGLGVNGAAANGGARPGGLDKRTISWPLDFRHVAHAESEEEAMFMLMRWGMDGMGKVADPIWAQAIKDLVKQRAADQQARAIAQSMINRERGLAAATPFQTLHVINGMPSSIYSETTVDTLRPPMPHRISTPGVQFSTPGLSPGTPTGKSPLSKATPTKVSGTHNPFERAFMAPTEEEKDIMANDREIVIRPTLPLRIKSKRPPLNTGNTKLQDLVTEEQNRRVPQVVKPEDIDGLPFPSVTGKQDSEPGGNSPTIRAGVLTGSTLDREMGEGLQDVYFTPPASRMVTPSLPTLEKATSVAIYFETLYHALLKPPKSLDAAHPNNYILNRRRREIALEQEMAKRHCSDEEKKILRVKWREEETAALRDRRRRVGSLSFVKLKVIGHGAFGVVSLVREKETGNLYAMKELRKADMLRKGQEGHVRAEKDLLAAASNSSASAQWIVKLHYSFQDVDRLYLVLTYEGGGDLLNLLVERDTFEEDFTRFYVAEMVLAIEATHKLGFIHRDIKPDNFLFSKEGHIRISDFGLANDLHWAHDTYYYDQQRRALLKKHGIDLEEPSKMKLKTMKRKEVEAIMGKDWLNQGQGMLTWRDGKRRKLAMSVCGTNSYMAPEVIRGMGYGFTCDWWSLGCIAFECLYGFPPFVSSSRHQTRQKILGWRESLRFPTKPRLSRDCTDFLAKLLCEPEDRLGSMATASTNRPNSIMTAERSNPWSKSIGGRNAPRNGLGDDGAADIKAHPWFRNIDWDNIHMQQAPYQPNLTNPADTRHFDDDIPNEPLAPPGGPSLQVTKDPMLADRKHGAHILDIRKQMAFAGWTYKGHKQDMDERFEALRQTADLPREEFEDEYPARPSGTIGRNRALSF